MKIIFYGLFLFREIFNLQAHLVILFSRLLQLLDSRENILSEWGNLSARYLCIFIFYFDVPLWWK
jgi:hypothetical protein